MRQFLTDLQKNLKGIWTRLDGGQRLVVVAVLLAAGVGLGAMVWYAGQPSYVVVFEARNGEDLQQARRLLTQAGVPFVPDDSGRSIKVDRSRAAAASSAIFAGGLNGATESPLGAASIIDDAETKSFKLDAAARVQAQTAIAALEGVQAATVAASRPQRSPFRDRDNKPRATVALRLKAGVPFEAVARSAASLAASQLTVPLEHVDVVNASTHQRWRFDPDREAGGGSSEFLTQQRTIAEERTLHAQSALDALYPGKTVITVGVELDPQWEVTNQRMLPPEPVMLSEQSTKDSTENNERAAGAAASGDPSTAAANADNNGVAANRNSTKKEMRDRKFLPDIGERRSGKLAPEIRRLSVALLYDRSLEQKTGFSKDELVKVVKSIVGWDGKRDADDAFSTMAGEFPADVPELAVAGPGLLDRFWGFVPTIAQLLGVGLVLLFLKGLLKRPAGVAAAAAASPAILDEANLPPDEQQKRMRREIERAISSDSAALAKMLESWLSEQKA